MEKRDNFGRVLYDVFLDGNDVGQAMMRPGHAKVYVARRSPR